METPEERRRRIIAEATDRESQDNDRRERIVEEAEIAEDIDKRNMFVDVGIGITRAVPGMFEEIFDAVSSIDEAVSNILPATNDFSQFRTDEFVEGDEELVESDESPFRAVEAGFEAAKDIFPETETVVGALSESITKFVGGWVLTGPLGTVAQGTRAGVWGIRATRGAISDFAVFDGHEERASDFLIEFENPVFNNVVTQYLAASNNTEVTELEGRMRNLLEGAALGTAVDGLVLSFKALRAGRRIITTRSNTTTGIAREADVEARIEEAKLADTADEATAAKQKDAPLPEVDLEDGVAARALDDVVEEAEPTKLGKESTPEDIQFELERIGADPNAKLDIDFDSLADDPRDLLNFLETLEASIKTVLRTTDRVPQVETIAGAQRHLADRYGENTSRRLFGDVTGDEGLAARIVAADKLAIASDQKLIELAKQLADPKTASDAVRAEFLQNLEAAALLDSLARGARSETARATRAMAITKAARESNTFDYDELLRQAGQTGDIDALAKSVRESSTDPAALNQIVRRSFRQKVEDVLSAVFYGNILGSLSTQLANISGNAFKVAEHLVQRTLAQGFNATRGALTGGRAFNRQSYDEFVGMFVGMTRGVQDSFRFSLKALLQNADEEGFSILKATAAERRVFISEQEELGTVWRALLTGDPVTDTFTRLGEVGTSKRPFEFVLPANIADESLAKQAVIRGTKLLVNTAGNAITLPGRFIVTVDEFFKTLASNTERFSLAYGDAAALSRTEKRSVHEIAAELIEDGAYLKEGQLFARTQTFQQKLGKFGQSVESTAQSAPALKLLIPFIRTPTNLVKDAYSNVAIWRVLSRDVRGELLAGGKRADMALAKATISTGLLYTVYEKFAAGEIRGSAQQTNSGELDGVERSSIFLFGKWRTFNRLDPLGMVVGFYADVFEMAENVQTAEQDEELQAAVAGFALALSSNVISKTWLRGISDFMAALTSSGQGRTDRLVEWTGSMAGNLMPLAGSNFERRRAAGQDEFARFVFDWADDFRQRIPTGNNPGNVIFNGLFGVEGNRQDLGIRRDPLGRPEKNKVSLTSVVQSSEESTDPLDRALSRLDFEISMPQRNIVGVDLDTVQYSRWLELRGQIVRIAGLTLEERLRQVMGRPLFSARTTVGQQDRVNDEVRKYTKRARKKLLFEDRELKQKVDAVDEQRAVDGRLAVNINQIASEDVTQ